MPPKAPSSKPRSTKLKRVATAVSGLEAPALPRERVAFDYKDPDWPSVLAARAEALARIRAEPSCIPALKAFYRRSPADFVGDWGMTFDPRELEVGRAAYFPFVPWAKQREWLDWVVAHWRARKPALSDKSRDCGVSWLAVALSCSLCLHHEGMAIGFGSRKEEYVDKRGEPKSLFEKGRIFMAWVPPEFSCGWDPDKDAPHMRLMFRQTSSVISGEAGDNIGRGDRKSIYFVDESAHLEQPEKVDAALSATTNCRVDVSSVNGMNNPFAKKRWGGKIDVFTFHWRDDPRKDEAWYKAKCDELDPVVVAQEIDIDYTASVAGVVIPNAWARACVGAAEKLGIRVTGHARGAMDVADEGPDLNAFCAIRGVEVQRLERWTGKAGDIFASTERAFALCDEEGLADFAYDADGLGAGVRGDARVLNGQRQGEGRRPVGANPYRGSGAVVRPDAEDFEGRKNKDFFLNRKAQAWWNLRHRAELTYRWVVEGKPCDPDEILSISPDLPLREELVLELSQAQYGKNGAGKLVIVKTPKGMASPNLADAVVMADAGADRVPLSVTPGVLQAVARSVSAAQAMGAARRFRPRLNQL